MQSKMDVITKLTSSVPERYQHMIGTLAEAVGDDVVFMEASLLKNEDCVVKLYGQKALGMKITSKISYITCDAGFLKKPELITSGFNVNENTGQIRLNMDITFDLNAFLAEFEKIRAFLRKYLSVERFGCCHRFNQCSDAKRCIIYDDPWALGCDYRQHLEDGRIFYGKNANI